MPVERAQDAGKLDTKCHRQRLLQPRAARQHSRCVLAHLRGERRGETVDVSVDQRERVAQLQHEAGVDDVLARCTPMNVAFRLGRGGSDVTRQRRDERNRQVAAFARIAPNRGDIETVDAALRDDCFSGLVRNDANASFRARERRFELEHARDSSPLREHVEHRIGREQRKRHVISPALAPV